MCGSSLIEKSDVRETHRHIHIPNTLSFHSPSSFCLGKNLLSMFLSISSRFKHSRRQVIGVNRFSLHHPSGNV